MVIVKLWQIESSFASQAILALMTGRSRWARLLRKKFMNIYQFLIMIFKLNLSRSIINVL